MDRGGSVEALATDGLAERGVVPSEQPATNTKQATARDVAAHAFMPRITACGRLGYLLWVP